MQHIELTAQLQAAHARKDAATQALAAADGDVRRKRTIETDYQGRLETAEAAINANDDIEAARDLAEERRNVEAQLTAARNMLRKSLDAQTIARNESQAAQQEVERAADVILAGETEALLEDFWNEYRALQRKASRVESYLPDEFNTRINDSRTQDMRRIIGGLISLNDEHTPISQQRGLQSNAYAARRAALIAGEPEAQPDEAFAA